MRTLGSRKSALVITVFYPGNSLMHQVFSWASRHPAHDLELSFARSLPEIQSLLRRSRGAVVDATEDPAAALTAFRQAEEELGADGVAVYTEQIHEGLEVYVRSHGSLLLLGPLGDGPWEGLFARMLHPVGGMRRFGLPTTRQERSGAARRIA